MQNKPILKVVGALVVVAVAIAVIIKIPKKPAPMENTPPVSTPVDTTPNLPQSEKPKETPVVKSSLYKDGNYSAVGRYTSPEGPESINVSLVLKGDTIQSAVVTGNATDRRSISYQNKFISGFEVLVVGKNIDEANLTFVSGSSLTPAGWNDAVSKIKAEARA